MRPSTDWLFIIAGIARCVFRRLDFHKNELPDGNFFLPLALVFRDTQANKQYYLFCNLTSKDLDFRNAGVLAVCCAYSLAVAAPAPVDCFRATVPGSGAGTETTIIAEVDPSALRQ